MVFLLAAIVTAIEVVVAFSLKEPPREKAAGRPVNHIREGLAFLFKHKIILHTMVIFSLLAGIGGVLHDYYQPVMKAAGISVAYFGIIYFVANFFGFAGAIAYPKLAAKINWQKIMFLYIFIFLAVIFSFVAGWQVLTIAAVVISSFSLGLQSVFIGNIINKVVSSPHRATALSIQTQVHLIFNFVLLTIVSVISDKISINSGMIFLFILAIIALASFFKLTYKQPAIT
jgi:hypothetical protein